MTWLNIEKIEKAIEEGWVSKRKHPEAELYILNYTPQTQYDWHWDKDTTMICRGLIVDDKWNVVARPFRKFFTVEQLTDMRNSVHHLWGLKFKTLFDGEFRCFDKVDGSLGILYPLGDRVCVATRGSFESVMAIKATEMIKDMGLSNYADYSLTNTDTSFDNLFNHYSFMVEIIYPENRIVVDYKGEEKLPLLAVIDKDTGKDDYLMWEKMALCGGWELAKEYTHIKTIEDLKDENDNHDGREGYVLYFEGKGDFRVKWKYDEYKRLHHVLSGLNEKLVWEWLRDGLDLDKQLADVPDEFYKWGQEVAKGLQDKFDDIQFEVCSKAYALKEEGLTRKEIALKIRDYKYRGIVFSILDDKDERESIWKIVKETLKNAEESNPPSLFS